MQYCDRNGYSQQHSETTGRFPITDRRGLDAVEHVRDGGQLRLGGVGTVGQDAAVLHGRSRATECGGFDDVHVQTPLARTQPIVTPVMYTLIAPA